MDFASSTRATENRTRWKGIVANSSVVPQRPSKVTDWFVVLGLTALCDIFIVYIGPFPRKREKEK